MMWHPLDGNMITADKHYERECQLVELDDGTYYCEECGEYVEEPCDED